MRTALPWLGRQIARMASMTAGGLILYREIYVVSHVQVEVLGIGLLFLAVPPSLWLDTIAKVSKIADAVNALDSAKDSSSSSSPLLRRASDRELPPAEPERKR